MKDCIIEMRDFSNLKYKVLCKALIESGYTFMTVAEYMEKEDKILKDSKVVIIRHDLCRNAKIGTNGLLEVEKDLGINSSYYFRYPEGFDKNTIKKVVSYGHEVGIHYDSLSKTKGNLEKAKKLFIDELGSFNGLADVKTAAMHGSPTKIDNRDFFKHYDIGDFGLKGEVYLNIDFTKIYYFTDTGRNWMKSKNNIRDKVPGELLKFQTFDGINSTNDLISFIYKSNSNLYLLIHPNRWRTGILPWLYKYFQDIIKNIIKSVLIRLRYV